MRVWNDTWVDWQSGQVYNLPSGSGDQRLEVSVVFTTTGGTVSALKRAGRLAHNLTSRIKLLVPQVVPYPLALTEPPVPAQFNERRLRAIAMKSPLPTDVRLCLCRDRAAAVSSQLRPGSLVVLGTRKRWWPTADQRLAATLRKAGHKVIVVETE